MSLLELVRSRSRGHAAARKLVRRRLGLEIGGPSRIFRRKKGLLPLYPLVGGLDNVNYGRRTLWEGRIEEGLTFRFDAGKEPGRQYILEATDLRGIQDRAYDFVLSSHTLEHSANPLQALEEWVRVLKPGGGLVLVVPHGEGTFDHRRPVTTMEHLLDDRRRSTGEDDLTHLEEILALHDLTLDKKAGDADAFRRRSEDNLAQRCLHHHVFETELAVAVVDWAGLEVLVVEPTPPYHVLVVARKPVEGAPDNRTWLRPDAPWRSRSPFASDRVAERRA